VNPARAAAKDLRAQVHAMGCPQCRSSRVCCLPAVSLEGRDNAGGLAVCVPFYCWACGAPGAATWSDGKGKASLSLERGLAEAWGAAANDP
jgi:hypothetical protein